MARGKSAEQGKILQRQLKALDLRMRGKSFRAIGAELNISYRQAFRDVEKELARLAALRSDKAETLRELEIQRLDAMLLKLDHWIAAGNLGAMISVLKIMERRAKLLGLDAPTKLELNLPRELLERLAKQAQTSGVDLAATFEALINEMANASTVDSGDTGAAGAGGDTDP